MGEETGGGTLAMAEVDSFKRKHWKQNLFYYHRDTARLLW